MPIAIQNRQNKLQLDLGRIRRSLKRLMKELGCRESELSILLVDDEQIRELNRIYLKRDRPTNVIAFAMTEGEFAPINPLLLGDIVISVETAARDASAGSMDLLDEVEFLLIHGLLHLVGHEHEKSYAEAKNMKARERELFYMLRRYPLA
ncbi:MAG: rRNA maturation RNase YbeY [Deltaproteobacteria bacterium]|nr:rRNA maturation RNase YbeY [Deltaproteobacteria bacterium]